MGENRQQSAQQLYGIPVVQVLAGDLVGQWVRMSM